MNVIIRTYVLSYIYKIKKQFPEYTMLDIMDSFIIFEKYPKLGQITMLNILELIEIRKAHKNWKIEQLLDLFFSLKFAILATSRLTFGKSPSIAAAMRRVSKNTWKNFIVLSF